MVNLVGTGTVGGVEGSGRIDYDAFIDLIRPGGTTTSPEPVTDASPGLTFVVSDSRYATNDVQLQVSKEKDFSDIHWSTTVNNVLQDEFRTVALGPPPLGEFRTFYWRARRGQGGVWGGWTRPLAIDFVQDVEDVGWWLEAWDWKDGTVLARIYDYSSLTFHKPVNELGSGSVTIARDNRVLRTPTPGDNPPHYLWDAPNYWRIMENNKERYRFVANVWDIVMASNQTSDKELTISGSGPGVELSWGVVLPEKWPSRKKVKRRLFRNSTWARAWLTLFREAGDRAELPLNLRPSFNAKFGTDGLPWNGQTRREIDCGSNLLDLLEQFADEEAFEWEVTPQGVINAQKTQLGQHREDTVRLFQGVSIEYMKRTEDKTELRDIVYVSGGDSKMSKARDNVPSVQNRAIWIDTDEAFNQRTRDHAAEGYLQMLRKPVVNRELQVDPWPRDPVTNRDLNIRAFRDYDTGDWIGLGQVGIDDETDTPTNWRVVEMAIDVSPDGVDLEVHLESKFENRMRKLQKQMSRLRKKSERHDRKIADNEDTEADWDEDTQTFQPPEDAEIPAVLPEPEYVMGFDPGTSTWAPAIPPTGDGGGDPGGFGATVYVQPDEPPGVPIGTLWFDTDEIL